MLGCTFRESRIVRELFGTEKNNSVLHHVITSATDILCMDIVGILKDFTSLGSLYELF